MLFWAFYIKLFPIEKFHSVQVEYLVFVSIPIGPLNLIFYRIISSLQEAKEAKKQQKEDRLAAKEQKNSENEEPEAEDTDSGDSSGKKKKKKKTKGNNPRRR